MKVKVNVQIQNAENLRFSHVLEQCFDRYMKEHMKTTNLWIKNNTSCNKSNIRMDDKIKREGEDHQM